MSARVALRAEKTLRKPSKTLEVTARQAKAGNKGNGEEESSGSRYFANSKKRHRQDEGFGEILSSALELETSTASAALHDLSTGNDDVAVPSKTTTINPVNIGRILVELPNGRDPASFRTNRTWTVAAATGAIRDLYGLQKGRICHLDGDLLADEEELEILHENRPSYRFILPSALVDSLRPEEQSSPTSVNLFSRGVESEIYGEYLDVIEWPPAFRARYGKFPKIYVRSCYRTLYELAVLSIVEKDPCIVTLFTGVPGIGKSVFLIYFIYRLFNDDRIQNKHLALEFNRGTYVCLHPTSKFPETGEVLCKTVKVLYGCPESLLLCDMEACKPPLSRADRTFIFSSPDRRRFKEIMKNDLHQRFTVPTWSEKELMFINSNVKAWHEKFLVFGGVPRRIFSRSDDANKQH